MREVGRVVAVKQGVGGAKPRHCLDGDLRVGGTCGPPAGRHVDERVPERVLAELRKIEAVEQAKAITLV